MIKEQIFLKTLFFIKNKYGLDFKVKRDNRTKRIGVYSYKYKNHVILYNIKSLASKRRAVYVAYHECGHIFNKLPYKNIKQQIQSEYMAERWALDCLKEDNPEIYKFQCDMGNLLLEEFNEREYEPYLSAWKMIKEYNRYAPFN